MASDTMPTIYKAKHFPARRKSLSPFRHGQPEEEDPRSNSRDVESTSPDLPEPGLDQHEITGSTSKIHSQAFYDPQQ